ncbi:MAG: ParB/RepB/Spo0J family partition protein [Patescibacteria group bacterium]
MCIKQGGEPNRVKNHASGLCDLHEKQGVEALKPRVPTPKPIGPAKKPAEKILAEVERTASGAEILARVREAMSTATLIEIPSTLIRPMPGQPRRYFDPERMKALVESFKSAGQLMPGLVRAVDPDEEGHTYELLDGERRWRASLLASTNYRAMLLKIDNEAAPYVVSVIANFNREGHTAMESSDAIMHMKEGLKMSLVEIGEVMGLHPVYVSKLYGLQRLSESVRDLLDPNITKGKLLSVSGAIEVSLFDQKAQFGHAQRLMAGEISLTALRQHGLTSGDRIAKHRIRDLHEEWRSTVRRADVLIGKAEDFISVVKNLRSPGAVGMNHSKNLTRQALVKLKAKIDEAITAIDLK